MATRHAAAAILAMAVGLPALAQEAAAPARPPSEAERLLFQQAHLANVREPRTLRYRYREEAGGQAAVDDGAELTLRRNAAGRCCDVHGEYLSGAMAVQLPDIPAATSNPVLLYFLEGEVRRLERTTKGQAAHFRRRIRLSFANDAQVADTPIRWNGRTVPARTVRIAPFVEDPFRVRFPDQAPTEYAFVLADAVPGGIYQLGASLPGTATRRTLTLEEDKP